MAATSSTTAHSSGTSHQPHRTTLETRRLHSNASVRDARHSSGIAHEPKPQVSTLVSPSFTTTSISAPPPPRPPLSFFTDIQHPTASLFYGHMLPWHASSQADPDLAARPVKLGRDGGRDDLDFGVLAAREEGKVKGRSERRDGEQAIQGQQETQR